MRVGIQTPDAIVNFEQLQLSDASVDLPQIDPGNISPVLPVEPAWIRKGDIGWTDVGVSLNGIQITRSDLTNGSLVWDAINQGALIQGAQRYYHLVTFGLWGGIVSPIDISITVAQAAITVPIVELAVANPGQVTVGPVYVPPGWELRWQTLQNGGAGDQLNVRSVGVQAPPGLPIPLVPPVNVNVST